MLSKELIYMIYNSVNYLIFSKQQNIRQLEYFINGVWKLDLKGDIAQFFTVKGSDPF